MSRLSKKALAGILAGAVGLGAVGAGLWLWQPWKNTEALPSPPPVTDPAEKDPAEERFSVTVGGEKILCTLYGGDGWSIYLPDGWTVSEAVSADSQTYTMYPDQTGKPNTWVAVSRDKESAYTGIFSALSLWDGTIKRTFHTGDLYQNRWQVCCQSAQEDWAQIQPLLTALARTFTCEEEQPFAKLSPLAEEPDWQVIDSLAVLFLDKDGFVVDDVARAAAEQYFAAVREQGGQRADALTGQLRLASLAWAGSYQGVGDGTVDVFRCWAQAQVKPEKTEQVTAEMGNGEYMSKDGWLCDGRALYVALAQNGEAVEKTYTLWDERYTLAGSDVFAAELGEWMGLQQELPQEVLSTLTDWFNAAENNGLLRFPYGDASQVQENLNWLFYDLGADESSMSAAEIAALRTAEMPVDEMDTTRLRRGEILAYLQEKLALSGEQAAAMLEASEQQPGTYLAEFDAWYLCRGDTEMQTYAFDGGYVTPSGVVTLTYTNPFLHTADDTGAADQSMMVKVRASGEGWIVLSNALTQ